MSSEFLLTTLVIVATPGTGVLYTLAARDKGALAVEETAAVSTRKVIVTAVLINILNPKLTIFFFAFLPQFVSANASHVSLRMLELSAVFMVLTFVIFALYGIFAAAVRNHIVSRPAVMTWMRRIFGGAFLALAGRLAFTQR